jgi:hypothetical protein
MQLLVLSHWTNPKITTIIHWIQFTAKEVAFMKDAPADPSSPSGTAPQLKRFYRMWCLKESIVKALGVGIDFNLKSFEFDVQDEEETTKVKNHTSFVVHPMHHGEWLVRGGHGRTGHDTTGRISINRELSSSRGTGRVKRKATVSSEWSDEKKLAREGGFR